MEEKKEVIVVVKTYEMLKFALPTIAKFPRDYKFTLGDRIQVFLLDLLERLVEASYLPTAQKRPALQKVNIQLEQIRYLYRLGFELGLYSSGKYKELSVKIDEIGRMVGGWIKSI